MNSLKELAQSGLYAPEQEHDACGVGMVANIKGEKTHSIITESLEVLNNLGHRGASGSDPDTGDGAGILVQMPDAFFRKFTAEIGLDPSPRRANTGSAWSSCPRTPLLWRLVWHISKR